MFKKLKAGFNQVLQSTNGTLNLVMIFVFAVAAAAAFPIEPLEGLVAAIIPFVAIVREWLKDGVKLRFNLNVFTYIAAGAVMVAPWLSGFFDALKPIVEALLAGDFAAVLPLLLPLINIILQVIRDKPWQSVPDPNPPHEPVPPGPSPDTEI
jgi:hypothetical protein